MSRFLRKKRTDIEFNESGSLVEVFNNSLKEVWLINDEELDYVFDKATDEELDLIVSEELSISFAKEALMLIDRFVAECANEKLFKEMVGYTQENYGKPSDTLIPQLLSGNVKDLVDIAEKIVSKKVFDEIVLYVDENLKKEGHEEYFSMPDLAGLIELSTGKSVSVSDLLKYG